MTDTKIFTFESIECQYAQALKKGYRFITCQEYVQLKPTLTKEDKIIVNRIDIDFSAKKTGRLVDIFNRLNIKGSFFLRLHAPEYNPFSFEIYRIIKNLVETGHELGYHSEIVDQSKIWNEDAKDCLVRDLDVINRIYNINVQGVASHGGTTGYNNLDFWKDRTPAEFGLLYEGYDHQPEFNLFQEAFYISDSEWTRWKCYDKGKLVEGNRKTFLEHLNDNHSLIYLLIHPDTYFDNHFYENER